MKKNYKKVENISTFSTFKKNNYFFSIIAFCLPVLLYLQTIKFGFTYFDDNIIIINNINFLSDFGNAHLAFLTDAYIIKSSLFYRPLQTLLYMVDIKLSGGNNPWIYHLSNILLLGSITSLLFVLLKKLLIPVKLALLGSLIYCIHPLFVPAVSWIPAIGDLMLTLFTLLSFLFLIEFLKNRKYIYLFLNWFSFTIALFCKETAAFLPLLYIIYYFTFYSEKHFEKKYIILILLYAISGFCWFCMRSTAIDDCSFHEGIFGINSFFSNLRVIPESLVNFFLPYDISPIPEFSLLKTIVGSGLIVILTILFFKNNERSKKEKIFCFSWFLILMFPPMLYKHKLIDYLDHRFILPLIGILLFVLFVLPKKWLANGDIKKPWIMIVIIVILSFYTLIKSSAFSDPMTFYNSAISQNNNSAILFYNRGYLKSKNNDLQGAMDDYNKAISICPTYEQAYFNRGLTKVNMGDKTGAIDDYDKSIALRPNYAKTYNNKGVALYSIGRYQDALNNYNKAIEINSNYTDAYFNRSLVKLNTKDYTGAIDDCEKVLQLDNNYKKALMIENKAKNELSMVLNNN